jgi:hypothetical protein
MILRKEGEGKNEKEVVDSLTIARIGHVSVCRL